MLWNISLLSLGHLPPNLLRPLLSATGQIEKPGKPWCCANTVQQKLEHLCVSSIILVKNLKPIWATMTKINSLLSGPSILMLEILNTKQVCSFTLTFLNKVLFQIIHYCHSKRKKKKPLLLRIPLRLWWIQRPQDSCGRKAGICLSV